METPIWHRPRRERRHLYRSGSENQEREPLPAFNTSFLDLHLRQAGLYTAGPPLLCQKQSTIDKTMISDKITFSNIFCVRTSAIHGHGLFSKTRIRIDSYLGTYSGKKADDDGMHVLWAEQEDGSWEGRDGENVLRYLNHSRNPSCEFIGFDLYALRDIDVGQELTIDYGPGFDSE